MREFTCTAPRSDALAAGTMEMNMRKLGVVTAIACLWLLAVVTPGVAGCICKDTRGTWCAKNCYVCFSNHAVPAGYCSYWLRKRKPQQAG